MDAIFAVTDPHWLDVLAQTGATEVNFWQPRPMPARQSPGTPYIFKVRGSDRVGGFGFFSYWTEMPLPIAWETFGRGNGAESLSDMRRHVRALRKSSEGDDRVGCIVLSDVIVLDRNDWIAAPRNWKPNVVRIVAYDIAAGEGARVWSQLGALDIRSAQPPRSALLLAEGGYLAPSLVAARRGQGAFRLMVMDAYERRCAITGERTLPALEAAHIRPFASQATHEIHNGILMRSDVHRLYDLGLVTVEPNLTFRVSRSIERDYSNGRAYYALDGKKIDTPARVESRPDAAALDWHVTNVFRP